MINFNLINRVSYWTHPFKTTIQLFTLLKNCPHKGNSGNGEVWEQANKSSREARGFLLFFCISFPSLRNLIFPLTFFFKKDSGKLLYPSVTFCPKYTWKTFPGVSKIALKI